MSAPAEQVGLPNASVLAIARSLVRLRVVIAPTGSFRHQCLRLLYVPWVTRMARQARTAVSSDLEAQVVCLRSLSERRRSWPARPRVLVLKLDHLGDFIVGLPAMTQIRQAFPEALITLCCASWNWTWAEQSRLADRVVTFDFFAPSKAEWRGASAKLYDRFAQLNLGRFELAIDLRHDPDTRPLLAHVDADVRAGFAAPPGDGGPLLDIALPDMEHISVALGSGRPAHAEMRLCVLAAAVTATFAPPMPHPIARIAKQCTGIVLPTRPFMVLAPGAGSPIRRWPLERLAVVGRRLAALHCLSIVLIGGRDDVEVCRALADALPEGQTFNLAGQTDLANLPGVIQQSKLFVGNDSGTSHLAANLGVPTVVVMGAVGRPEVWRADGPNTVVLSTEISCSGCYLNSADQCAHSVKCLDVISAQHVLDACEVVLRHSLALRCPPP